MIPRKPMTAQNALTRLRDLCDRGEYCTGELREKMRKWGIAETDQTKIIRLLEDAGLVDDARFARAFAHTKAMTSHWGRVKIKLHLIKKKLDGAIIRDALDSIDLEEYVQTLRDVLAAKARTLGEEADTFEGRTKIFRYAVGKGYEPALVAQLIRNREFL